MTIKEELIQYSRDCLEDKIPSGKKHKQACKRFLRDLDRIGKEDFPYIWDEEKAGKIVKWFSYLRHSKGELAGKPILLTTWQKFFLCQLYGWRNKIQDINGLKNHSWKLQERMQSHRWRRGLH